MRPPRCDFWQSHTFNIYCGTAGSRFITSPGGSTGAGGALLGAGASLLPGTSAWAACCGIEQVVLEAEVDPAWALAAVESLPLYRWAYRTAPTTQGAHAAAPRKNIGPTAEDWQARFPLGQTDPTIDTLEFSGVTLAAVKGLAQEQKRTTRALEQRQESLEREVEALRAENAALSARIALSEGPGSEGPRKRAKYA